MEIRMEKLIYENPLSCQEDIKDFIMEGQAKIFFQNGAMYMENQLDAAGGQKANYVLWCPEIFPAELRITWEFQPVREPGLCILFFGAMGRNGENPFDEGLVRRTGEYIQYHHGDIDAFHVSYFRRKEPDERAFHTCNLRKSYGFHLVAQGGDPIPDVEDVHEFYRMELIKKKGLVLFYINGLEIFRFEDDGKTYGPLLGEGCIGFRQLAPLLGAYRNLKVYSLQTE